MRKPLGIVTTLACRTEQSSGSALVCFSGAAGVLLSDAPRVLNVIILPNVQDEPRPWLARAVLLGARIVTAMVVGSGALLGLLPWGEKDAFIRSSVKINAGAEYRTVLLPRRDR